MKRSRYRLPNVNNANLVRKWAPLSALLLAAVFAVTTMYLSPYLRPTERTDSAQSEATGVRWGSEIAAERADLTYSPWCDTATGTLKVLSDAAFPCYAQLPARGEPRPGVTQDAITVVFYLAMDDDPVLDFVLGDVNIREPSEKIKLTVRDLVVMYNDIFETYGRTVDLKFLQASGNAADESAARADALSAVDMGAFAVIGGPVATNAWSSELQSQGVVCISCAPVDSMVPYVFTEGASSDQAHTHFSEYVAKKLAGKPAIHGGQEVRDRTRVLGHIFIGNQPASHGVAERFRSALSRHNVDLAVQESFNLLRVNEQAPVILSKFRDAGVTTVVLHSDPMSPMTFTAAATSLGYEPEWLIGGSSGSLDLNAFARRYDQSQWRHAFGPSFSAIQPPRGQDDANRLYRWYYGGATSPAQTMMTPLNASISILFTGIQAAGPELTRRSMQSGLYTVNAGQGDDPNVPRFSYGPSNLFGTGVVDDHFGIDDATEIWWDAELETVDETGQKGRGAWRFTDGGKRYLPGTWTDDDKLFDPTNAPARLQESEVVPQSQFPSPQKTPATLAD